MNENNKEFDISKLSQDDWIIILFYFAYYDAGKHWYEYRKEINENSRFFPKAKLLEIIRDMKIDAEYKLQKGDKFYRARVFHSFFMKQKRHKKELKELEKIIIQHFPEVEGKTYDEMEYILNGPFAGMNKNLNEEVTGILRKRKTFWGYGSKDSDAPPRGTATAGRANSAGISYLYICDSVETAIMEVRPIIGQEISVATIEVTDEIRLFDFCKEDGVFKNGGDPILHNLISRAFSEPYTGRESDYYSTQYLCEFIKELGFEGIRYYSSLDYNSKDIVIFDTLPDRTTGKKKYQVKNSKVYVVKGYHPSIIQIAPWKNEEESNKKKA